MSGGIQMRPSTKRVRQTLRRVLGAAAFAVVLLGALALAVREPARTLGQDAPG